MIKRAKGLRSLEYKGSSVASFIASVTQSGYSQQSNQSYLKKSLPKLELKYTDVRVDETVHEIDFESIKNLPYGVDGTNYQWVDLDGEGLTGILSEQADAWYYKRNLGNGTFWPNRAGRAEAVPRRVECVNNCSISQKADWTLSDSTVRWPASTSARQKAAGKDSRGSNQYQISTPKTQIFDS